MAFAVSQPLEQDLAKAESTSLELDKYFLSIMIPYIKIHSKQQKIYIPNRKIDFYKILIHII